jgi:phosphoglycerate dehydrogenase-like enzyme
MNEIFDSSTVGRLHGLADVVWGSDEPMPEDEFKAALADVDAVVFGTWHYGTAALHEAGAGLRAVLEVGGGHRHPGLDYEYLFDRGIPVGSCAPAFGPAVAELALTLALAAARKVLESDRGFRAGTERYLHDGNDGAFSLHGRTVGFIGCGGLSRGLQPLLEPFEVNILGYDPWIQAEDLEARGIIPVSSLEDVMGEAEVVFVLAVPTPTNEGMLSRTLLERLRPSDVLVLVSRAHVVDFDALTALLLDGRFRAGIDVFPTEPLAGDHPIRGAETAVLTAHLAGALPEALQEIGRMVVDDLASIFKGHEPARMQYATPSMRRDLTGKT